MFAPARHRPHRTALVGAVLLSLAAPGRSLAEDQRAILAVVVNDEAKGDAIVVIRDDDILIDSGTIQALGIRSPGRAAGARGEALVSLRSLAPSVEYEFDEIGLTLRLRAQPSYLATTTRNFMPARPAAAENRRDTSAFANYSVTLADETYALFTDSGVSIRGALAGTTLAYDPRGGLQRGLTAVTVDTPAALRRIVIGDAITRSGPLGSSVVLGGVTVGREYSVDPYFVRTPTLDISGTVTTPSTADVYVNDRLIATEVLPPGAFDFSRLPATAGRQQARVVIRDAFGGVRELSTSSYVPTGTLARGLHDYRYSFGLQRSRFGTANWSYHTPTFISHHRVGLTDDVTVGGRLDVDADVTSGGVSLQARTPLGEIDGSLGLSRAASRPGLAGMATFARQARRASALLTLQYANDAYRTVSAATFVERPLLDVRVQVGLQVGAVGHISLQRFDATRSHLPSTARTAVVGSVRVGKRSDLFVSGGLNKDGSRKYGEWSVGVAIRTAVDSVTRVTAERRERGADVSIDYDRSLPTGTGWGTRLHAGPARESSAMVAYQGRYGRYETRLSAVDPTPTVTAAGAIVAVGGGAYATRPVQDGFAVVRVPDVRDVRTFVSQQEVGRTGRRGDVVVPNLLPYYANVLDIAAEDIPLTHAVNADRRMIALPYRGGALVVFPVYPVQIATGTVLLRDAGVVVTPGYGELILSANGREYESPLGSGAEFYLENVPPGRHPAVLTHGGRTCRFAVDMPVSASFVIELGTLVCER